MATGALIGGSLLGAGANIIGGAAADEAARQQSSIILQQGALAREESEEEARRLEIEARKFRARQNVLFGKSGVTLEGSPLLVLEETRREGARQATAVRRQGVARANLAVAESQRVRNQGRARLLTGFLGGGASLFNTLGQFSSFGGPR